MFALLRLFLILLCLNLSISSVAAATLSHTSPLAIHGVNYYPRQSPWSLFWPDFKAEVIQTDFVRIQQLGFNTVRVFVPYQVFGGAQPKAVRLQQLRQLLDLAASNKLLVIITLFDFYTDYGQIEPARQHLKALTRAVGQHPAIRAWDLKNEIDLDYSGGRSQVLSWLKAMALTLRQQVKQPISASVSRPEAAAELHDILDYLTFHYYGPEADFETRVAALRRQSNKPLVLGEYGFHTWTQGPDPHQPEHQFNYYQAILAGALNQKLAGSLAWCLYDFSPDLREPWVLKQDSVQYHLGLLNLAGQPKAGLGALNQGMFLRDARDHRASSLETRQFDLVLQSSRPTRVTLERQRDHKLMASRSWHIPAGVTRLSWPETASNVKELIYLRERYVLRGQHLIGPGQRPLAIQTRLELRRR